MSRLLAGRCVRLMECRHIWYEHLLFISRLQSPSDAFISQKVVFFSRQWTAFNHPDPTNHQYKSMVKALCELTVQNGWNHLAGDFSPI